MTLRNLIITLMCAGTISASAVPAKRGEVFMMTQPDGTKVALTLEGDEHFHHYVTADGLIAISSGTSINYATVAADGSLKDSGILVHDASARTVSEKALVANLSADAVKGALRKTAQAVRAAKFEKAAEDDSMPMSRSNSKDGIGRLNTSFPTIGDVKTLVILAEFSDVPFTTPDAHDYFTRMLNEEGFSDNGAYGSARDYYLASSNGLFRGQFDVYGPVKLPQTQAYYGTNDAFGNDVRPSQMLVDALNALDEEVDFSQYDLDEDRFIDNVFVFYSGMAESHGGAPETIWPHQGNLTTSTATKFDNVYARRYACTSELQRADMTDGIGTFCHEFGHVLGIPDLYDIYNGNADYTPNDYSIMDSGSYSGNSMRMPLFSAFERNALGWMGEDLVEITGPASCTLENLGDSGKAYLISTDRPNEYYVLENRQRTGWDVNLPGHGMLVWHIDYVMSRWNNNTANTQSNHQYIDLVEANGSTSLSKLTQRGYPFPGTTKKTEFVFGGKPNFLPWSGKDLGMPITDITEKNGVITFNVAGGGDDPASVRDVVAEASLQVSIEGGVISAVSNAPICISDISGRVIAQNGGGQLTTPQLATGIYIVASKGASQKVVVK